MIELQALREKQWLDRYEEASVGILLEAYAEAEGARCLRSLERAALEGTAAPMPEELDARCQRLIGQTYKKSSRRKRFARIAKVVSRSVAAICVLLVLTAAVIFAVEPWRISVVNRILETDGKLAHAVTGFMTGNSGRDLPAFIQFVDCVIPDGYERVEQSNPYSLGFDLRYKNKDGEEIVVGVSPEDSNMYVDIITGLVAFVEVREYQGVLIDKNGLFLYWLNEKDNRVYSICATGLSQQEIRNLAHDIALYSF